MSNKDYHHDTCVATNVIVLDDTVFTPANIYTAFKVAAPVSMTSAITEEIWGKPAASINKDSFNTALHNYNDVAEDVSADIYFHWDETYFYIGVKTPDNDICGWKENYKGDGLQFKLQAGSAITSEASDICLTWGEDGFDAKVSGQSFQVRGGNANALNASTKFNIVKESDSLSLMLAVPHTDLGYTADEIKSGATYAINLLRISGRHNNNGVISEESAYAGWLEWGTYWDVSNKDYHHDTCVATNVIVLDDATFVASNIYSASKTTVPLSLNYAITEATWGKPAVSIDKNSFNTALHNYNDVAEDISADIYFHWDETYFYIGVKSVDPDLVGWKENYKGDGLQFKLQAGTAITSEASDICLTWGKDGFDAKVSGQSFQVRGGNANALNGSTKFNIVNENGTLSMMLAVPHTDLGYAASEVKDGATYAINLLRISGRHNNNGVISEDSAYAGWLEWGTYWDVSSKDYHHASCVATNVIRLQDNAFSGDNVHRATKASEPISLDTAITEENWGKPNVTINKNTFNTALHNYHDVAEDLSADLYFRWDANYFYIGVKSVDPDVAGWDKNYIGDGLQFKVQAGTAITSEASDICLTWGEDGFDAKVSGESFQVRGGNADALNKSTKFNMINDGGTLSMMLAIPHTDLGYAASEVKDGATYAINLLRITGHHNSNGVISEDSAYAGWLEWGTYWDVSNTDMHHASCVATNVIVLEDFDTTHKASKVASPISLNNAITEAVWGKPAVTISKDSFNTALHNYNDVAEDVSADIYFHWDANYLYIGVKSADPDVTGWKENYIGDGLQFKLQAGNEITSEASNICLTWGKNGFDPVAGGQSFQVRSGNADALNKSTKYNMINDGGTLSMMLAIPHSDLGYTADEVKGGATYAINLLRITGHGTSESTAYAGWLEWGTFWDVSDKDFHHKSCVATNIIMLDDGQSGSTGGTTTVVSNVMDVTLTAKGAVGKEGLNDTMKVVTTANGTYAAYMTNGPVFTKKGHSGIYEFHLYEIGKSNATDLGLFYTRAGDIDLVATNSGVVYAVGGSSSNVLQELSHNASSDLKNEKAVLQVFEYDPAKGKVINQVTSQVAFAKPNGYHYLTASLSSDKSKIHSFYLSGSSMSWFTYDIGSRKWNTMERRVSLAGTPSKMFVFGEIIVYEANGIVYSLDLTALRSSRLASDISDLKDAYMDRNGKMNVLYAQSGKVFLRNGAGSVIEISSMNASDYGRLTQDTAGELHILAMESGKPATITVLSGNDFGTAKAVVLDSKTVPKTAPIINVARNGSVQSDTVSVLYPASYRVSNHWYFGEIGLN